MIFRRKKAKPDPCPDDPVFSDYLSMKSADGTARHEEPEKPQVDINHKTYLGCFGNRIDLVSIVCYWVDFVFMMYQYQYCSMFKSVAALRPIRLISILPGTAVSTFRLNKDCFTHDI